MSEQTAVYKTLLHMPLEPDLIDLIEKALELRNEMKRYGSNDYQWDRLHEKLDEVRHEIGYWVEESAKEIPGFMP